MADHDSEPSVMQDILVRYFFCRKAPHDTVGVWWDEERGAPFVGVETNVSDYVGLVQLSLEDATALAGDLLRCVTAANKALARKADA